MTFWSLTREVWRVHLSCGQLSFYKGTVHLSLTTVPCIHQINWPITKLTSSIYLYRCFKSSINTRAKVRASRCWQPQPCLNEAEAEAKDSDAQTTLLNLDLQSQEICSESSAWNAGPMTSTLVEYLDLLLTRLMWCKMVWCSHVT